MIGGTGKVTGGATDAKVVVAANGGSDLIYLPDNDRTLAGQVVDSLTRQDYVSGVFVDDQALGTMPSALPSSAIGLEGSAKTPVPSIVVNFRGFVTNPADPNNSGVQIADTTLQQGQGMHGNFGRTDTYNNMAATGPDFKKGYQDTAPASNTDVTPTLANILGLTIPTNGDLKGRVLSEALPGGPDAGAASSELLSEPATNGVRAILDYQQIGATRYFDAAGFANRTVGLTMPTTGGPPLLPLLTGAALVVCGVLGLVLLLIKRVL